MSEFTDAKGGGFVGQSQLAPVIAALTTQAGAGELTALRLVVEVGQLPRFGRAEAWSNDRGLS